MTEKKKGFRSAFGAFDVKPADKTAQKAKPAQRNQPNTDDTPSDGSVAQGETAKPSGTAKPVGGDTLRMRAINFGSARPAGSIRTPLPRQPSSRGRMPELRRVPSEHRFGLFSFIFGFLWLLFRMIFFSVLVMGIVGGLSFIAISHYVKTPEVTVPNIKGVKIAEAFRLLSDKKLSMVKDRDEPGGVVADEIIEQNPMAGIRTKEGGTVHVVVSSGQAAAFVVPNVTGESRENAINKIHGARLDLGNITYLEDDKIQKDYVINQTPEANKGLEQTGKVDLLVSSGPKGASMQMPDVTGRTLIEAKAALNRLGVTDITTDPANAMDTDKVTDQAPLVGKNIQQTQHVLLTITVDNKARRP